ncbi:maker15 [Drosophila busckii]|uniref:Maker15 n=2 Tax=Drosophila busckii TaxID=30019 RepID=A0A0M4EB52_DROBS|nr:maker15 [Drosophila busckii]
MLRCVFNTTHLIKAQEFQSHLLSCESRPDFDRFVIADALPAELSAADQIDIIQCKEDWDAEPVVESYKPESHITNKLIMRRLTGGSASVRREFRESERKRFQNITEVNQDESM